MNTPARPTSGVYDLQSPSYHHEVAGSASGVSARSSAALSVRQATSQAEPKAISSPSTLHVALLTGGSDKPYALGMATALSSAGVSVDFIGSDELDLAELHKLPKLRFLNLRGDQSQEASFRRKIARVARYYWRLIGYAATARPRIFHVLWNNKFEFVDRVLLMAYYRLLGRRIVLTAHNVNIRKRDNCDSWFNRLSLRIQYHLAHHIFVHTERMKSELLADFGVPENKTSVIPFGINNTVTNSSITAVDAKRTLGLRSNNKVMLCFGQIAPYKGLEYLVDAFSEMAKRDESYRLIIAGKVKQGQTEYWNRIRRKIDDSATRSQIIQRIENIPDEEVELYFKAADVLIVPYIHIFQSGVPFLAYSFGLPVIATDVGSLREDIVEGRTGFVCQPRNSSDLAGTIDRYFKSELFRDLEGRRLEIKEYANERYSWNKVAAITTAVYSNLLSSH
ncbi:MAG TPA: glycosyltransferase family 4 protein [Pyrinomonadaceae bacterium]